MTDQAKHGKELGASTVRIPSEVRYGITKQPQETCPLVDDALDDLKSALKELDGWERCDDVGELQHKCDMGVWYADRLNVTLEEIRERTAEIREWGQQWKNLAKDHAPMTDEYISANAPHDLPRSG